MSSSRTSRSRILASLLMILTVLGLATVQTATAQTGADMAVTISGSSHVRIGENITYTITGTNVGSETVDAELSGWVPDWFNFVSQDCGAGPIADWGVCRYAGVAPGQSVSMTITLQAFAGNKQDRHVFEQGFVSATNDTNFTNDTARVDVIMTGPCPGCPNKK